TLSVWGRKTHEVLMTTYIIIILWLISPTVVTMVAHALRSPAAVPVGRGPWLWFWWTNPYSLVYAPYTFPGQIGVAAYLGFLAVCLCLSGALAGLATRRIRGVALAEAGRGAAAPPRSRFAIRSHAPARLPRLLAPSLDGNPVLWREWHRAL